MSSRVVSCRVLAAVGLTVAMSACTIVPVPVTEAEMKAQAERDRSRMFSPDAPPLDHPLTLPEAVARALVFNLDRRTRLMEEALAVGQTRIDRWDLLPKLAVNAGYTGRDSPSATRSSRDLVTQSTAPANPTYSSDRDLTTADLGVTWNVLDLGVSWINAHQSANKALIVLEHRRKAVHTLVQDVRFAFWRAAAAQVLEAEVLDAVAMAERSLHDARGVEAERLKPQAEILRYQKALLESLRQLEGILSDLSSARDELAALLDLPPDTDVRLDVPSDESMAVPAFGLTPEAMEEMAFVNNPDLREQVYLSRIAVDETKKTIVKMMPGVNLSLSDKWDSNSFLVDHQWFETGAKLSWNLINLISAPDQYDHAKAGESVAESKRLALRMAVLAQVHVSYRQFTNASRQFQRADDLYRVEQRLAGLSRARADNDAQSVMERIATQTAAIAARLRRYQSYAQMESALGKVHSTLGFDLLPDSVETRDPQAIVALVSQRLDELSRGIVPVPPAPDAAAPPGGER